MDLERPSTSSTGDFLSRTSYSPVPDTTSSSSGSSYSIIGTGYNTNTNRYSQSSASTTPRQPLGESTGNSQASSYYSQNASSLSSVLCNQHPLPTTSTSSIPTPSYTSIGLSGPSAPGIIPTHTSHNGMGYDLTAPSTLTPSSSGASYLPTTALSYNQLSYGPASLRHRRDATRYMRLRRAATGGGVLPYINPIYHSPQFQQYRHKQESREDKEGQKWTDNLEDWFLDAILLMPHMGRRKYTLNSMPHGRNMLIMEYLWIAYCRSLKPDEVPDSNLRRGRKQVSSHIQVLKNFFVSHRCFHFFFPASEKEKTPSSSDKAELESFKNNPVLTALCEGRLPDVRPNYKYFEQLLQSDNLVAVRPKTVWVYISNSDVRMDENENAYTLSGAMLDPTLFPHLKENLKPDREYDAHLGPRSPNGTRRNTILHEYMKSVEQTTSVSTRALADRLEEFPDLSDRFNACTEQEESLNTSNPIHHCEMLHLRSVIELPRPEAVLPAGSGLSCITEVIVTRPEFQSHTWKCVTLLQRPSKLCAEGEECVERIVNSVGTQFTHRPGCEGSLTGAVGVCDCATTRRSQDIKAPFPVHQWVSILSRAAKYVDTEAGDNDGEARRRGQNKESEAARLLRQVCMLQEIISQDPAGPVGPKGSPSWTRRALLVWTFENTVHLDENKKKVVAETPGTSWRFMTLLDPMSQYHQQQVYITNAQAAANAVASANSLRQGGMLPASSASSPAMSSSLLSSSSGHPPLMSDGYGNTWDSASSNASRYHYTQQGQSSLSSSCNGPSAHGFGGLDFGLATPPPSASSMSYVNTFDSTLSMPTSNGPATTASYSLPQHHDMNNVSFMSNSTMPTGVGDTFLSTVTFGDALDDVGSYKERAPECDPALSWDDATVAGSIPGLDNTWYSHHESHTGSSQADNQQYHQQSHAPTPAETGQANYFTSQAAVDINMTVVTTEDCKDNQSQQLWADPTVAPTPDTGEYSGWTPKKEDGIDSKSWLHMPLSSPPKLDFSLSPLKAAVRAQSPPQGSYAGSDDPNSDAYALQALSQLGGRSRQGQGQDVYQQRPAPQESDPAWVMVQPHAGA
ncbi:uncharacterized protein MKZ38_008888 [Zalerion maritima]|uniref:TEA domain-containing protein n=1 Tax=Zalerion maritima TaxID=339359 RepID=A0AAD5RTV1_9PEZI|nr:uncharacterized protein MKZ38_008888 [Zalerion maritima]